MKAITLSVVSRHPPSFRRCRSLTVVIALCAAIMVPGAIPVSAYSCGGGAPPHCYGIANWVGGAATGSVTYIWANTSYDNDGTAFLTNEMWDIDDGSDPIYSPPGCRSRQCWVETGLYTSAGTVRFFWADQTPTTNVSVHLLSGFSAPASAYMYVAIRWFGNNLWQVTLKYPYDTGAIFNFQTLTGANAMWPNIINVGGELTGFSTGTSAAHYFATNQWCDAGGVCYLQNNDGNPPDGIVWSPWANSTWYQRPSQYPGGIWSASCFC